MKAKIILETLQKSIIPGYESSQQALMAWGAEKFLASDDVDEHGKGWLQFRVNGTAFRGWVRITIEKEDLFTVVLENHNNKTGEFIMLQKKTGVKADQLGQFIDEIIEGERQTPSEK